MVKYAPVVIPSNNDFLKKWHSWINYRVSIRFKRNKARVLDVAQDVRVRLISKDFIGRWFYRHLSDELLDLAQASKILGLQGKSLSYISNIPIANNVKRSHESALWRVSDLLEYAKFDYVRYYYSIQNHTIDTQKMLRLLGYPDGKYNSLASLYRQGRLLPSELTEHLCTGDKKTCPDCEKGRASLHRRGLSLVHNWEDPAVESNILRLRWNDGQLAEFLRNWHKKNRIVCSPDYVMRPVGDRGIDAGLLKYADIIIQNTVANRFKQIGRSDDLEDVIDGENVPLNGGKSPGFSTEETISWETDDYSSQSKIVYRDMMSSELFESFERKYDVNSIVGRAGLDEVEQDVVYAIEMMEQTARQYAEHNGIAISRVHKVHASALSKLRRIAGWDNEDLGDDPDQIDDNHVPSGTG